MTIQERSLAIRKDTPDCLEELFEMQNRVCDLCGHPIQDLCLATLDHSIPVIRYARTYDVAIEDAIRECNDPSNLRCAHRSCNSKKHDKSREEWFALGLNELKAPPFLTEDHLETMRAQIRARGLIQGAKNKASGQMAKLQSMGGKVQGPISRDNKLGIFAMTLEEKLAVCAAGGRKGGAVNRASGHIQKIGTTAGRRKACELGCITRKKKDPEYMAKMREKQDPEKRRQRAQKLGRKNAESGHCARIAKIKSAAKIKANRAQGRKNAESGHLRRIAQISALKRLLKTIAWG